MPNFNLTIFPAQIEFLIKPGINLIQAYQVTNNSSETLSLNTEVLPWIPIGNEGQLTYNHVIADSEVSFTLNNADLKLGQSFSLKPQESRQLVLKISTSPNAQLKDYYYTFFVSQNQNNQTVNSGNLTQSFGKIGSHVLLSVSQTETNPTKSEIRNFSLIPKIRDTFFTPLTFKAEVKNNSDHFIKTQGTLTINKNDLEIKKINLTENNVLANSSRVINCQDQEACTISPPFWPGRYTATISLDSSLNAKPTTISFFVFPFSFLAFILLLAGLVFGFWSIKKSKKTSSPNL